MYFRYEAPVAPNLEVLRESVLDAFPTAIVGFAVAFSVAKVYSKKHDYIIDGNQVSKTTTIMSSMQMKISSDCPFTQSRVSFSREIAFNQTCSLTISYRRAKW